MTPEERTLISDLFRHLREVEGQPRDPEAEAMIRQAVQNQPLSAYYMAQTVLVQQHALTAAQQRIEELERDLKEARERQAAPSGGGGSFLSNALGLGRGGSSPWGSRTDDRPVQAAQPAPRGPWGAPPPGQGGYGRPGFGPSGFGQPGYGQPGYAPRGGGFLATAATTAAGVAGGMLAASAISSMLSSSPGPFGEAQAASAASDAGQGAQMQETAHDQGGGAGAEDAGYYGDDGGFDAGGGGEDESWI